MTGEFRYTTFRQAAENNKKYKNYYCCAGELVKLRATLLSVRVVAYGTCLCSGGSTAGHLPGVMALEPASAALNWPASSIGA